MGERLSIATQPTKKKFKSVWLCGMIWFVKRLQSSLERPTSRPCLDIKNHQDSQFAPLWYGTELYAVRGETIICTKWYNTRYPCLCREQRNSGFRPEKTSGRRHLFVLHKGKFPQLGCLRPVSSVQILFVVNGTTIWVIVTLFFVIYVIYILYKFSLDRLCRRSCLRNCSFRFLHAFAKRVPAVLRGETTSHNYYTSSCTNSVFVVGVRCPLVVVQ